MLDFEIDLDLDGCLCNFTKKANEILGTSFQGADNDWAWDTLLEKCPYLYRDLEVLEDAYTLLEFLRPYSQVLNLTCDFGVSFGEALEPQSNDALG